MGLPTDPKRLKVVDRVIYVLEHITAGADYFLTPYEVNRRFKTWTEVSGSPTYSVHLDSGGLVEQGIDHNYDVTFYISVRGIIMDMDNPVGTLIKSNRDVQKAINEYAVNRTDTGSLSYLATHVWIEESPNTDNGDYSVLGQAGFEQRIKIVISGDFGEL